MIITGVLPCSINITGTEDITFNLLMKSWRRGTPMPELEGDHTLLIFTPGKKSKLSMSLTVSMQNARSKGFPILTTSLLIVFSSSYGILLAGVWTTPLLIIKTSWRNMEDSDAELPVSMISYGLSMTKDMMRFYWVPMVYYSSRVLETEEDQYLRSKIRLWGWLQYCTMIPTLTKKGGWDIPVDLEEYLDQGNILSILPSNHLNLRWLWDHFKLQVGVQCWCRTNPEVRSKPSGHLEPQATHVHKGQRILGMFAAVSSCHGSRLYLPTSIWE